MTRDPSGRAVFEAGEHERPQHQEKKRRWYYRIRFRQQGREYTVECTFGGLRRDEVIMVKTDHGPEPAFIVGRAACPEEGDTACRKASYVGLRRASADECERFARLPDQELQAFVICRRQIESLGLPMHLVRVERFFNGSKIIFYFTSANRVDFRALVKKLVQEFRTRVELRQIGVRHETQMTGGIGSCGRELCCSSFLTRFDSVSIKMAKTQDLPLNPTKISGLCNRLLCCLTYEYENYRDMKREMPRVGRTIELDGKQFRVLRHLPLPGQILARSREDGERVLSEEEWRRAHVLPAKENRGKKGSSRKRGGKKRRHKK